MPTKIDERKALILDLLRRHLEPMTRAEITAALDWPDHILMYTRVKGRGIDPLLLLIEEGKVSKDRRSKMQYYKADPDISSMIALGRLHG